MDKNTNVDTPAVARFLELLLPQYQDSPNLISYFSIFLKKIEELQLAHKSIREDRTLDRATGKNLDVLGEIIGASRIPLEYPDQYFGWLGNAASLGYGTSGNATIGGKFKSAIDNSRQNATVPLGDDLYLKILRGQIVLNTSRMDVNSVRAIILSIITITTNYQGPLSYLVSFPDNLSVDERNLIAKRAIPSPMGIRVTYADPVSEIFYD